MSEDVPEELIIELEALEHLLGDGGFAVFSSTASATELSIPLIPRDVDGAHEAFVEATLSLTVRHGAYPAEPPSVALRDPKGLEDDAIAGIVATLDAEAAAMAGEMVLLHLYELAAESLTAANSPTGTCSFCLEALLSDDNNLSNIIKLPCFHCFHQSCFKAWFRWRQQEAAAAAAEAAAVPALPPAPGEERPPEPVDVECAGGWVARQVYTVRCPACRIEVTPAALAPTLPSLVGGVNGATGRSESGAWGAAHPSPQEVLDSGAMERLRDLQERFSRVLAVQAAAGGLVQENVAVSLAELEAAAAEKRQATAAAAEEEEGREDKGGGGGGDGGGSRQGRQQGRGGGGGRDGGGRRGRGRGRGRGGGGGGGGGRHSGGRGRGGSKPPGAPPQAPVANT